MWGKLQVESSPWGMFRYLILVYPTLPFPHRKLDVCPWTRSAWVYDWITLNHTLTYASPFNFVNTLKIKMTAIQEFNGMWPDLSNLEGLFCYHTISNVYTEVYTDAIMTRFEFSITFVWKLYNYVLSNTFNLPKNRTL